MSDEMYEIFSKKLRLAP